MIPCQVNASVVSMTEYSNVADKISKENSQADALDLVTSGSNSLVFFIM